MARAIFPISVRTWPISARNSWRTCAISARILFAGQLGEHDAAQGLCMRFRLLACHASRHELLDIFERV
jgi:hypothetical protein